jgi:hypothetical protein
MKFLKALSTGILTLVLILFLNDGIFAQNNAISPDQRITDVYGTSYVNDLKTKAPERIAYLNYILDHSYEIKEIPYSNGEKMIKVSEVSLNKKYTGNIARPAFDINNFNVLLYNFKRDRKIKTLYRVDNTNKVIVFLAEEEITEAFNQTK